MKSAFLLNFTVTILSIFCNKVIIATSLYSSDFIQRGMNACHSQVNFCTINKQNDVRLSCCSKCSCWTSCYEKGECCPDIANATFQFKHSCQSVYYKNPEYWRRKTTIPTRSYEMVTACPDGTDCSVNPFSSSGDVLFDDLVVVYTDTEPETVIFQNKMCAECNGIHNYKRWRFIASDCMFRDKIPEGMSGREMFRYMLRNCILYSFPPAKLEVKMLPYTCGKEYHKDMISACNVTGRWNIEDEAIFEACADKYLYAPVTHSIKREIYKNVYCFMCNNKEGAELKPSCYQFVKDRFTNEFIEIMDLQTDFSPLNENTGKICNDNEIFDELFDKCRSVICPGKKYFMNGVCVYPPYELSSALYYKFSLMLFPFTLIPTSMPLETIDFDETFNNILVVTDMKHICSRFKLVSVEAYFHLEMRTLHYCLFEISALASLDMTCTHENLAESLQSLTHGIELNVTVHGDTERKETIKFTLAPDNRTQMLSSLERLAPNEKTHFSKTLLEKQEGVVTSAYIEPPYFCSHVTLNDQEYTTLLSKYQQQEQNMADTVFSAKYSIVVKTFVRSYEDYKVDRLLRTYSVCLDQYTRLTLKPNVESTSTALGTLSLVLSCVSMICTLAIFLLFCITKKLNNGPMVIFGCALVNLFIAQGVFQFGSGWNDKPFLCQVIGIAIHYFWLASVFALNAYCVLIFRKIVSVKLNMCNTDLAVSILYVYGLPVCFVLVNIMFTKVNLSTSTGSGYGAGQCHMNTALMRRLLFALPIFLTIAFNIVINCMIAVKIKQTQITANSTRRESRYAIVFFRLLVVAGITWIFGILNSFVSSLVLDYCFVVFVGGQGIFLLFSFVCRKYFIQQLRKEFHGRFMSAATANVLNNHTRSTIQDTE